MGRVFVDNLIPENWSRDLFKAYFLNKDPKLQSVKVGWAKYDEMMVNGNQIHFYRKPKRFGGLKSSLVKIKFL